MSVQPHSPTLERFDGGPAPDPATVAGLRTELRELPELEAPGHIWQDVQARVLAAASPRTRRRLAPMALAASVLAAAATVVFMAFSPSPAAPAAPVGPTPRAGTSAGIDLATLLERSRMVEANRRAMPTVLAPSGVERVLQVGIRDIDASLNDQLLRGADPAERQALLRERVEMMESLTQLERYRQRELVRQAVF